MSRTGTAVAATRVAAAAATLAAVAAGMAGAAATLAATAGGVAATAGTMAAAGAALTLTRYRSPCTALSLSRSITDELLLRTMSGDGQQAHVYSTFVLRSQ